MPNSHTKTTISVSCLYMIGLINLLEILTSNTQMYAYHTSDHSLHMHTTNTNNNIKHATETA